MYIPHQKYSCAFNYCCNNLVFSNVLVDIHLLPFISLLIFFIFPCLFFYFSLAFAFAFAFDFVFTCAFAFDFSFAFAFVFAFDFDFSSVFFAFAFAFDFDLLFVSRYLLFIIHYSLVVSC